MENQVKNTKQKDQENSRLLTNNIKAPKIQQDLSLNLDDSVKDESLQKNDTKLLKNIPKNPISNLKQIS